MDSLTLTVAETAQILKIHVNTVYKLCGEGRLPVIRLGRRIVIPKKRLDAFLAGGQEPTKS